MQRSTLTRSALLAVLLAGLACARNKTSDDDYGSAQDTTAAVIADSATQNQTETGMTDSTGRSTLGTEAEKTRPDQGQPVTSKGDTINPGVDSSTNPGGDSSTTAR
jgi:hypothetical protein